MIFSLLALLVVLFFAFTMFRGMSSASSGTQSTGRRPGGYRIPAKKLWNKPSARIWRENARLDKLTKKHESLPDDACKYTYTTQNPYFDFNGYSAVDDFASLRRKNEEHERHLRDRISGI